MPPVFDGRFPAQGKGKNHVKAGGGVPWLWVALTIAVGSQSNIQLVNKQPYLAWPTHALHEAQ